MWKIERREERKNGREKERKREGMKGTEAESQTQTDKLTVKPTEENEKKINK